MTCSMRSRGCPRWRTGRRNARTFTGGRTLLTVNGLKVGYGGIQAVNGVDFEVREGELVSLIGSNGAGKTTTMRAIIGTLPAGAGHIEFLGRSIKGRGAWDFAGEGLVMVPEGRGVFTRMTITENLQIGAYIRKDKAEIASGMGRVFVTISRLRAQGPTGRGYVMESGLRTMKLQRQATAQRSARAGSILGHARNNGSHRSRHCAVLRLPSNTQCAHCGDHRTGW